MNKKKRSGFKVMAGLIGLIKPLILFMILAIIMGTIGNLAATFITILGGYGLLTVFNFDMGMSLSTIFIITAVLAVSRGILRYMEQASNHYIAFKLLARIRNMIFTTLRKLAPAKLDSSEKGNLISIITSDIELLEVFYAHTISPIAIAVLTSIIMCIFIGSFHPILGIVAAVFYILVGAVIPIFNGKKGSDEGQEYRDKFGELNSTVLDNLYGLEEIIQYNRTEERLKSMAEDTERLEEISRKLKDRQTFQTIATDTAILLSGITVTLISSYLVSMGQMEFTGAIIAVIAMMSSFGPTAALSALSNNLHHTLACGNRVLDLLEEEPVVDEITGSKEFAEGDIKCSDVSFSYNDGKEIHKVLDGFNAEFKKNKIYGIHGKSGCGKSTLLKLLMRFYETDRGSISYGGTNVNEINTLSLRNNISYVTQETFLFHDTIENNIKIAKEDATREEVIEAAKNASIHDFIMSLPNGYETRLNELGDCLSGGERQRIGIARAFLHGSDVIFLDEPTSNIDSLNEGIILKSLYKSKKDKTIILVSHRKSTMAAADEVISFK